MNKLEKFKRTLNNNKNARVLCPFPLSYSFVGDITSLKPVEIGLLGNPPGIFSALIGNKTKSHVRYLYLLDT